MYKYRIIIETGTDTQGTIPVKLYLTMHGDAGDSSELLINDFILLDDNGICKNDILISPNNKYEMIISFAQDSGLIHDIDARIEPFDGYVKNPVINISIENEMGEKSIFAFGDINDNMGHILNNCL